jgi:hypothetical protein
MMGSKERHFAPLIHASLEELVLPCSFSVSFASNLSSLIFSINSETGGCVQFVRSIAPYSLSCSQAKQPMISYDIKAVLSPFLLAQWKKSTAIRGIVWSSPVY